MDVLGFPVAGSWFSARVVADGITQVTEPHVASRAGVLFSGDTLYDSRLFDELPGSDISSYLKTIARLRSLAGIRMVCPGHDACFDADRLRELCDAYLERRGHAAARTAEAG